MQGYVTWAAACKLSCAAQQCWFKREGQSIVRNMHLCHDSTLSAFCLYAVCVALQSAVSNFTTKLLVQSLVSPALLLSSTVAWSVCIADDNNLRHLVYMSGLCCSQL